MRKSYVGKIMMDIRSRGGIIPVEELKDKQNGRKDKRVGFQCITLGNHYFLLKLLTTRLVPTVVGSTFIKVYFIMYLTIYTLITDLIH